MFGKIKELYTKYKAYIAVDLLMYLIMIVCIALFFIIYAIVKD